MQSVRAQRFLGLALAGLLLLALAPAASAATPKAFRLDLGARSDYVAQTNLVQCVGASMQMMLNMIRPGADRQRRDTAPAAAAAPGVERTDPNRSPAPGRQRPRLGRRSDDPRAAAPTSVVGLTTIGEALLTAAKAMRDDRASPVGLLVWRGRHAWVMSGFTADRATRS